MKKLFFNYIIYLLAISCFFSLNACGKKSPLSPPESSEYPKKYPQQ